ncbi:hypothetical protein G7078_03870 [Sphingomonas sinipercae]|uniref:Uncharacterized protein n=1 Tax=Sphingomonas sinipercae TaxID=2714944 RepID=A0A6G7ZM82_9SPHN|nr:hypothetical protein [Sphingomonas sinipercae]QIL02006.1 hypothetical protein G7078_03870 [Sphingomonas sinipercae]
MRFLVVALALASAVPASAQVIRLPRLNVPPAAVATDLSRKVEILQAQGLSIPASGIQAPVVLSPRQPWIDSRTHLEPVGPVQYRVDGDMILFQHDGDEGSFLTLYWAEDPSKRHIVDCAVSETSRPMRYSWTGSGGRLGSSEATIDKGRVAVILPSGVGGKVTLQSMANWRLHGCEITPVAT